MESSQGIKKTSIEKLTQWGDKSLEQRVKEIEA